MTATSSSEQSEATPEPGLGRSYAKLFSASAISNLGDGIGLIAYPWLASAVTRNALLIALVAIAQRLPWLLFSLPAGVITDRHDRRRLMIGANTARAVLTTLVALAVLAREDSLLSTDALAVGDATVSTDVVLYLMILVATLLLGSAEVLYDNAAQTFMPSIVEPPNLERANGRLWSAELVANALLGPVVGALLLSVSFALPFVFDAATFVVSAALIALITSQRQAPAPETTRASWRTELADGFRWLWRHDLLRQMAIILGLLNALGMMTLAILVLFSQEVLDTSAAEFALLSTGGAIGGMLGGWLGPHVSARLGSGPSLWLTLLAGAFTSIAVGLLSWWPAVWLMFAIFMFAGVLWNVITVSLRQTIIPDQLLGRVNSVYRFFAWGMMPVGTLAGGLVVWATESVASREAALRMPWFVSGILYLVLFAFAAPRLTTARIEAAREGAT